jgi:beta-galactosidase
VGTFGNEQLWSALARGLMDLAELSPALEAPAGVELTERWQAGRRLLFVLNHSSGDQRLALDRPYTNLVDGDAPIEGTVGLPPHAVMVLEEAGL